MNFYSMAVADFFDLDGLDPDRRIIARALLNFYVVGSALTFVLVMCAHYLLVDESHHSWRMMSRWTWLALLVSMSLLARRGHLLVSAIVVSVAMMLMLVSDVWRAGGLTIISTAAIIPLLLLTFLNARRAILIVGTCIILLMCGVHVGLDMANMQGDYALSSLAAISSFAMTMSASMWVTYLCAHVTDENVADVERRTHELEEARSRERVRRLEAEEIRRLSELAGLAKSRFLANMSHELRTPLSAILGYAEMLAEDLEEIPSLDEMYMEDATRIQHAAHHLLRLINDILDLSRLEAFKMPLMCELVSCGAVMAQVELVSAEYRLGTPDVMMSDHDASRLILSDRVCLVQLIVQAVLEHGVLGTLSLGSEVDGEIVLRFEVVPQKESSLMTESLIELRVLLREALSKLLDVQLNTHESGWSMHLPEHVS